MYSVKNRFFATAFVLTLTHSATRGQDNRPTFEVASVKLAPNAPIIGCRGGPGSADPGYYRCAGSWAASPVIAAI